MPARLRTPSNWLKLMLAVTLLFASVAEAARWKVRVVRILDGDTMAVVHRGRVVTIRLIDIDAPETGQPFGRDARRSLQQMVRGHELHLTTQGRDRYRRTLAHVERVPDGLNVNLEQVRRGMAWGLARGAGRRTFETAERQAREARRGLWADATPIVPHRWRHGRRRGRNAPSGD